MRRRSPNRVGEQASCILMNGLDALSTRRCIIGLQNLRILKPRSIQRSPPSFLIVPISGLLVVTTNVVVNPPWSAEQLICRFVRKLKYARLQMSPTRIGDCDNLGLLKCSFESLFRNAFAPARRLSRGSKSLAQTYSDRDAARRRRSTREVIGTGTDTSIRIGIGSCRCYRMSTYWIKWNVWSNNLAHSN